MATTTTEESSPVPTTVAPQQPDLEDSLKPNSEAEAELGETQCDREEKEDEEHEEVGRSCDSEQENTKGKSLDSEWVEERFRIDRKKLETMLYGELNGIINFYGWNCQCYVPELLGFLINFILTVCLELYNI